MAIWKTLPIQVPTDGEEIWVRLNYWFGPPFKAIYNSAAHTFTDSVNSIVYPIWTISRWRSLL